MCKKKYCLVHKVSTELTTGANSWRQYSKLIWAGDAAFPRKLHMRPVKTKINLRNRTVWSESLQNTLLAAKDPMSFQADSIDSDQLAHMRSPILAFAGRTMQTLKKCCIPARLILSYIIYFAILYLHSRVLFLWWIVYSICPPFWVECLQSTVYNRPKVYIHQTFRGCCLRDYHWTMKSNRTSDGPTNCSRYETHNLLSPNRTLPQT